jgi:hypothetical protein
MATEVVSERLGGGRPSRPRAFVVSVAAGVAAGIAVYKVLRSGGRDRRREG